MQNVPQQKYDGDAIPREMAGNDDQLRRLRLAEQEKAEEFAVLGAKRDAPLLKSSACKSHAPSRISIGTLHSAASPKHRAPFSPGTSLLEQTA